MFAEANGQNPLQRANTPKKMECFFKTDKLMLLTNLLNAGSMIGNCRGVGVGVRFPLRPCGSWKNWPMSDEKSALKLILITHKAGM